MANIFNLSTRLLSILPGIITMFVRLLGAVATLFLVYYVTALIKNGSIFDFLTGISALTFSAGAAPASLMGIVTEIMLFAVGFMFAVPLVMTIMVFLTIVFLFFRIFFMLLTTYLRILLLVLFAPVFMLAEALPGRNAFSYWFRNLLGELLTFPIVTIIFLVGYLIVNNFKPPGSPETPLTYWQPPYLYGIDQSAFVFIAGMGLLFMTPDLVKVVRDMLGIKSMPLNFGLGTFFSGAAIGFAGATGLTGKALNMSNQLFGTGKAGERLKSVTGVFRNPFQTTAASQNIANRVQQVTSNPLPTNAPPAGRQGLGTPSGTPLNNRLNNRGGGSGSGGSGSGGTGGGTP